MLEMRLDAYCIAFIRSSIILTGGVSCELSVFIFDLCCPWIYSIKYSSVLFRIQNYPIKQETADLNLEYKQFKLNYSEEFFSKFYSSQQPQYLPTVRLLNTMSAEV